MVVFMMKLWHERHKILIAGAYGTGNLGDEAILQGLLKIMRTNNLLVFSRDPAETTRMHMVRAKRRNILDVLRAEKLLIGGGELFQDNMAWKYALLAITSKILRKQVTVYAVGVSHLSNTIERIFTRICLNLVDEISVRDPDSKNRLLDMGIIKVIDVVDDPSINVASALYTEVSEIFNRECISKSNFLIGVTLRYTRNNKINKILINFFTKYFKDIIEQYINVFQDSSFVNAFYRNIGFGVVVLYFELVLGFFAALIFDHAIKGEKWARILFLLFDLCSWLVLF